MVEEDFCSLGMPRAHVKVARVSDRPRGLYAPIMDRRQLCQGTACQGTSGSGRRRAASVAALGQFYLSLDTGLAGPMHEICLAHLVHILYISGIELGPVRC